MSTRTTCGLLLRVMAALALLAFAVPVAAQTPYIPYFGKNQIRYDKFEWFRYETDHFIIYYYPEIEPHLERMAGYAESAYQQVSSELKHDLAHKVPLILFQTSSEFQQQNVIPGRGAGRCRRIRRADSPAHRDADGRAARSALSAHPARAHAPVRLRHHPGNAGAPKHAAVGPRRARGLHDRHLAPARSDGRARRRGRRHRSRR